MKRFILSVAIALTMSGCANQGVVSTGAATAVHVADVVGAPAPAELQQRTIADEKALTIAAKTVDVLALSASALVQAHVIVAGSPRALALATALDTAREAINAAQGARTSVGYAQALSRAEAAIAAIRDAMGSN